MIGLDNLPKRIIEIHIMSLSVEVDNAQPQMRIMLSKLRTVSFLLITRICLVMVTVSWGQINQTIWDTSEDRDFALDQSKERNESQAEFLSHPIKKLLAGSNQIQLVYRLKITQFYRHQACTRILVTAGQLQQGQVLEPNHSFKTQTKAAGEAIPHHLHSVEPVKQQQAQSCQYPRFFVGDDQSIQPISTFPSLYNKRIMHRGKDRRARGGGDTELSKTLSWILRHGAVQEGLTIEPSGYVPLEEVMQCLRRKGCKNVDEERVRQVVYNNDKKRFEIQERKHHKFIRATQGHSMKEVNTEELLTKIEDHQLYPTVVHGTFSKFWGSIKEGGLKRMTRNHIHFAPGMPKEEGVVSGMRGNCDVIIQIDLKAAMNDGIEFFISSNNVILTQGIQGVLPPKYFLRVTRRDGSLIQGETQLKHQLQRGALKEQKQQKEQKQEPKAQTKSEINLQLNKEFLHE